MSVIEIIKILTATLILLGISAGVSFAHFLPETEPITIMKMTKKNTFIEVVLDTSHIKRGTYFDCVAYGSDGIPFATKNSAISSTRVTIVLLSSFDTPSIFSVECHP